MKLYQFSSLKNTPTNYLTLKIKESYSEFISNNRETQIRLFWIPSHKNIVGNELADTTAKRATENPPSNIKIPHTDLFSLFKMKLFSQTNSTLIQESESKGKNFFENYYQEKNKKPWFEKLKLTREEIVQINRIRADHYHLNYSLHRVNLIQDPSCSCGYEKQDLDHIIWQCPNFNEERNTLVRKLAKFNIFLPCIIHIFLQKPQIIAMKVILDFLKKCHIQV